MSSRAASTPPVARESPTAAAEASARSVGIAGGFVFSLAQSLAFVNAFVSVNVHDPNRVGVANWGVLVVLAAAAALALTWWGTGGDRRLLIGLGTGIAVGLLAGLLFGSTLFDSLGPEGLDYWLQQVAWVAAASVILFAVGSYFGSKPNRPAGKSLACLAAGFQATFYLGVLGVLFAQLEELEVEAARVNESPAWGLLTVGLSILVALALARQRSGGSRQ